jgi:hypothetical protein
MRDILLLGRTPRGPHTRMSCPIEHRESATCTPTFIINKWLRYEIGLPSPSNITKRSVAFAGSMQVVCSDIDLFDVSSSAAPSTVQPLSWDGQANDPPRAFPDVTSGANRERGPQYFPSRASTGTECPMAVTGACSGPQALIAC